jgi:general stress protein 26
MKNVLKFKFQDKEGFFSVVEKSNLYYTLVQKDTPKVKEIEKTKKLWISYELKEPNYQEVLVEVSYDHFLIQWVYETLEKENNLYFKKLDESLCVLKFPKK